MLLACNTAKAEDQPFLTLDATDIEPQYGREIEQNFGWSHGKSGQAFDSFESETELEYGLTDQIKLAAIGTFSWARQRDHTIPISPAQSGTSFDGIGGEIVYQMMNVYFEPIGLAVLVSPSIGPASRAVEAKLLAQKNFFNDRLRFVVNAGGEFGAEKQDGAWNDVSALTFDAGLSYNVTWAWSAGLEFNAGHDYAGLLLNGRGIPQDNTYYLGPTVQYVAHPWTASLGLQEQLPWSSDLTHSGGAGHGFLGEAERLRVEFRITRDFY